MQEVFTNTLRSRRAQISARWDALLRIEKVNTPLANPDTLVYLFDRTLDEVFAALREPLVPGAPVPPVVAAEKNPLYAYFVAGEQAVLEELILAQAGARDLAPKERDADFAHLRAVMQRIARRDLSSLDGLCKPKKPPVTAGPAGAR